MSMLSAQTKRLRKVADDLDFYTIARDIRTASMLMRDAADTIDELRTRCQELQEREWQTCRMELLPDEPTTSIQPMRCTACGHKTYAQLANYCPNCGRQVIK